MKSLAIIFKEKQPDFFTIEKTEDFFFYKNIKYQKIPNWVGVFYSFFTYQENGKSFLSGIDYSFASREISRAIIDSFKQKEYVNFSEGSGEDPISILDINLKPKMKKMSSEERKFSEMFGDDYLYKSENTNEYCLIFYWPPEVEI